MLRLEWMYQKDAQSWTFEGEKMVETKHIDKMIIVRDPDKDKGLADLEVCADDDRMYLYDHESFWVYWMEINEDDYKLIKTFAELLGWEPK